MSFKSQNSSNLISGVFYVSHTKYYQENCNANQLKTAFNVAAYFSNTPSNNITSDLFCKAGNVKFNNNPLNYNNSKKYYTETEVSSINQQQWKVSGHSNIPNMNFIFNGIQPSFNISENLIKDTLKKGDTLFITLNNIQNADSIMISITDDSQQQSPHHVALIAPNYTNTYYLPPLLFATLINGPRAVISIEAIKYKYQTVSNKRFLFRNMYSFVKSNIIIN